MSERRRVLIGMLASALVLSVGTAWSGADAQDLEVWRARKLEQAARATAARREYDRRYDRKVTFDHPLLSGAIGEVVATKELPAGDSAAVVAGFARAETILRERYGEAAIALLAGARWGVEYEDPPSAAERRGLRVADVRHRVKMSRLGIDQPPSVALSPLSAAEAEHFVLMSAGTRLANSTPALRAYAGYAAFRPDDAIFAEVARRLATSWSGTARRCATGAVGACEVILRPFDPTAERTRYYDPSDFRAVVTVAPLPGLSDSVFFAERRRCIEGVDAACAGLMDRINPPDPFNAGARGTLLTYAIEIGGSGAVARAAERPDAPSIEVIAHIAGVSRDALLIGWRDRVFRALDETRGARTIPLLFTTLAWSAVLLALATRRRYL